MKLQAVILAALLLMGTAASSARAAGDEGFPQWLADLKRDATAQGISPSVVDAALGNVTPLPRVLELDRRQPETTLTLSEYLAHVLVPERIKQGRRLRLENRRLLRAVSDRYGVSPKTIMALWAIESSYGKVTGGFQIVGALATLAYDGRRPDLFRAELISALKILQRGRFTSVDLKGSWAGAMGQTQFMPSTYLGYAVSYGHAGEPDIWHEPGDVFASAANYLAALGWKREEAWGREVKLPARFDAGLLGLSTRHSLTEWAHLGVRRTDGGALPRGAAEGSVVSPDGVGGRAFLVYDNFRTIMKWNHSTYFAVAVGLLGDAIGN